MALYPGAVFKPTPHGGKVKRNRQGRGVLHVAVSNARSLPPWNANTWHFYVAHDGYCEQYVDTDFRAYASAAANDDAILIETAGGTGSSAVLNAERWTPAAFERLADIMAWESKQPGGAPLDLLPDAQPGRRGWGPHRLGIKHSGGPRPGWWQPGSEVWSSVLGKECPGNAKVAQIPALIARARQIASGAPGVAPIEEDDMPTPNDVSNAIANRLIGPRPGNSKDPMEAWEAWVDSAHYAYAAAQQIAGLTVAVDRLAAAVAQRQGVDVEELRGAIREEMANAVVKVEVSVDADASTA